MKPTNKNLLINHFSSAFTTDVINDMNYDIKKNNGKDMLYVLDRSIERIHKKAEENLKLILNKRTYQPGTVKKETKRWELRSVK